MYHRTNMIDQINSQNGGETLAESQGKKENKFVFSVSVKRKSGDYVTKYIASIFYEGEFIGEVAIFSDDNIQHVIETELKKIAYLAKYASLKRDSKAFGLLAEEVLRFYSLCLLLEERYDKRI